MIRGPPRGCYSTTPWSTQPILAPWVGGCSCHEATAVPFVFYKSWLCTENLCMVKLEFLFTCKIGSKLKLTSTASGPSATCVSQHMEVCPLTEDPEVGPGGILGSKGVWDDCSWWWVNRTLGNASWVPCILNRGRGGWKPDGGFLKRNGLLFVTGLWGILNWLQQVFFDHLLCASEAWW